MSFIEEEIEPQKLLKNENTNQELKVKYGSEINNNDNKDINKKEYHYENENEITRIRKDIQKIIQDDVINSSKNEYNENEYNNASNNKNRNKNKKRRNPNIIKSLLSSLLSHLSLPPSTPLPSPSSLSNVINLDFLLNQVMGVLQPLDYEVFKKNELNQPLVIISSSLRTLQPYVLSRREGNFYDLRSLLVCIRTSMSVPGLTGE